MSFSGEGFHFGLGCEAEGGSGYCQGFSVRGGQYHVNQSSFFLYCSVISIVPCLILLLLPVLISIRALSLLCLQVSSPAYRKGKGDWGAGEPASGSMAWRVSAGPLNWGVSLLNHDTQYLYLGLKTAW